MALWHPLWVAREQLEYTGQHSPFDHVLLNSFAGFNTYSVVFPISSTPWSGPLKQITIRALRTTSFSPSFRLPFQPPKKPAPGGPGGGGVFFHGLCPVHLSGPLRKPTNEPTVDVSGLSSIPQNRRERPEVLVGESGQESLKGRPVPCTKTVRPLAFGATVSR